MPLFGITYAAIGIVSSAWWLRGESNRVLRPLSGVLLAMGALNAYAENWVILKRTRPEYVVWFLMLIFLLPYAVLSVRVMEQMEGMSWRPALWSSFLPLVCLFFLGFALGLTSGRRFEDAPLALFFSIALICGLHVPAFAYGKEDVVETMKSSGIAGAGISKLARGILKQAIVGLGAPVLIVLSIQVATRDDWRLFGANIVTTAAILSLFLIVRNHFGLAAAREALVMGRQKLTEWLRHSHQHSIFRH